MTRSPLFAVGLSALLAGCSEDVPVTRGFDEPVRVIDGQFHEGKLPGLLPLTPEEIAAGAAAVSPTVTGAEGAGGVVRLGDPSRTLRGRVSTDAVAVAFRFEDLGTGYWVEPARGPDPLAQGEYQWSFRAEFLRGSPPGPHRLLFAAIGKNGESGTQLDSTLCVQNEVPDNSNACVSTLRPPGLVVSLSWDQNADVDLAILTPDGQLIDANNPATAIADGAPAPGSGVLDHDSNPGCVIEGIRRENFVYQVAPPSGSYAVYANLFDACGQQSAHFTLSVLTPVEGSEPGTFRQIENLRRTGILLAAQANGGAKPGLFVTKFVIP